MASDSLARDRGALFVLLLVTATCFLAPQILLMRLASYTADVSGVAAGREFYPEVASRDAGGLAERLS